jgi:hypothetical protein
MLNVSSLIRSVGLDYTLVPDALAVPLPSYRLSFPIGDRRGVRTHGDQTDYLLIRLILLKLNCYYLSLGQRISNYNRTMCVCLYFLSLI